VSDSDVFGMCAVIQSEVLILMCLEDLLPSEIHPFSREFEIALISILSKHILSNFVPCDSMNVVLTHRIFGRSSLAPMNLVSVELLVLSFCLFVNLQAPLSRRPREMAPPPV
jgi:hypothetical protein